MLVVLQGEHCEQCQPLFVGRPLGGATCVSCWETCHEHTPVCVSHSHTPELLDLQHTNISQVCHLVITMVIIQYVCSQSKSNSDVDGAVVESQAAVEVRAASHCCGVIWLTAAELGLWHYSDCWSLMALLVVSYIRYVYFLQPLPWIGCIVRATNVCE